MLKRLLIKNIALISVADIEFDGGLNVLSGETGSGKSVILDSLNFVLGSKADKTMIRFGEQEASVRAEFVVGADSPAVEKIREYDIESDGEIIISRRFTADGKGGIKINGCSVTAAMLKSVTQRLVDVHGQSEHFYLLGEDNQLKLIDEICGDEASEIKTKLSALIAGKKKLKEEIESLGGDESQRERKLDILSFQINEIETAAVKVGEFDELKAKQNIISNTEKIFGALNAVNALFDNEGGCIDGISSSKHYISGIAGYSEEYAQLYERLENLNVEATDISESVSDLADSLTFDENEAREIDERLSLLRTLKKKYGDTEEKILQFLEDARNQYDAISDSAAIIERNQKKIESLNKQIFDECRKLTELRKRVSAMFCQSVTEELKTLNIPNAQFTVDFVEYDFDSAALQSANGSDKISFMFSANKGEPLKPLNKVISGGEMSRFMLAIKTRLKNINGISTYVFDEIDAGISGYTAKTVAEKFIKIAENTQILAVSHLPQVCAASSAGFLIYKEEEGGKTVSKVKRLTDEEKVYEIVRLTGNVESEIAVSHAKELINQFKKQS